MFRTWTFGRKVGAAFAATVLALLVVAIVGYRSTASLTDTAALVAHTHEVRRVIAATQNELATAEAAQRGYLLTGSDAMLEPYRTAIAELQSSYADLRRLTSDNPSQQRRLDDFKVAMDARLARFEAMVGMRRTAGAGGELANAAVFAPGEEQSRRLHALADEMDREEVELLGTRKRDADASAAFATTGILWGSAGAILLAIVIGYIITRSLASQVGSAVRHIQSSSTELQAASNQQATAAREQAAAMGEIATTISELLATSRQISEAAKRVAEIATQTASAARTGDSTVVKGSEASGVVRKQVDVVVDHMLDLGKRSQQVGVVLDIVGELAEQTNILAVNATIEAAGAGEQGRRFGVVADEIRKLADRVAASTKEIRAMIEDVRGAVNTTVMATEAGSKAVDMGASQVVEMAVAFRQIAALVATTTDAAREIELSTKQQSTAIEQVNVAITNVAQATRETEASASQTLQTSGQLTGLSSDLLRLVQSAAN